MTPINRNNFSKVFIDYGTAIAAVAIALGLTASLWSYIKPQATPLFLAAVAVAAWRGSVYPSLLAVFLSALALDYFFNLPLYFFELSAENLGSAIVFLSAALLISYIDAARKQASAEREHLLIRESEARRAAEEANRAKDTFLAMVTHELRSPLNAILGWTQMLKKDTLDAEQTKQALSVIERNARIQAQLVEDLLDISRIRTGQFRINACPIEIREVIDSAIESVAPAIAAKNIRLERDFDRRIGLISGDAERLQQVVWNLLTNAVKFTPEKGQIQIRLERANWHARLIVQDNGAGISSEFLPFVFDSFRQSDEADRAKHKGLGLGLAIVRHLIEAHGGTVSAASAGAGMGATFTVELPLLREAPSAEKTGGKKDSNLQYV